MEINQGKYLSQINSPYDLKKIKREDLPALCEDLRQFIVDNVATYGGHFGASLGVTELTVALHYVFNTPTDQVVWDVGHQAYGHKILTGRKENFHTNRVMGGISGFPKRKESEYDSFGVGHSSTSISAALGMAMATAYKGDNQQNIAVIGDGAMTGGMAFEAMNHAGVSNSDVVIILNDNCMAIDPNVGALKDYLTDVTTSKTYNKLRDEVWNVLGKVSKFGPDARSIVAKVEKSMKSYLLKHSNLFESLKLRYFGPVDGHDIDHLVNVLEDLKNIPGPKILHCVTTKGKGYELAEKEQTKWHATSGFNKTTGQSEAPKKVVPEAPKYQDVFGHSIVELEKKKKKIMGITPAMPSGSSLNIMMKAMPDRAFDVGIAEQHAVTLSAGMATQGLIPFCNIYSTFMQRGYDQVIHDVCIQNLNVVFCLDRAGVAGADGATHHGAFDIAYMRCIPNLVVSAPMNEGELRNLMYTAQLPNQGPFSIRYPRGKGVTIDWQSPFEEIEIGKGRQLNEGKEVAILTIGHIGNYATKVVEQLKQQGTNIGHYDMRFVKPIDEELLHQICKNYSTIITVEDGCLTGGFGSAVLEFISDQGYAVKVKRLGIPDKFIDHGTQEQLHALCGYDQQAILDTVVAELDIEVTKTITVPSN
ncbi:MAG: 1-deoxy-D-xylulose-5-phosphate synthase [Cyclobacteriaceae bacterium]